MHLRSSDANVISGEIYIFLYYIVYTRTTIPIHPQSSVANVISGGIYISLYYIVYTRITNKILISDRSKHSSNMVLYIKLLLRSILQLRRVNPCYDLRNSLIYNIYYIFCYDVISGTICILLRCIIYAIPLV